MTRIEPKPWRGVGVMEKVILFLLFLSAAVILALPLLDQVVLRRMARLPGARPLIVWLINDYNTWIVGGVLLLLFALSVLWIRRRLINNRRLWFGTGCPECQERELVRVSRQSSDRFYGLLGVPAYRYACRNCTWRGLRIARREYTPEQIAELEASLLRFDPDGTPPVRDEVEPVAEPAPVAAVEPGTAEEAAVDPWSVAQPVSELRAADDMGSADEMESAEDEETDYDDDLDFERDFDDELVEILNGRKRTAEADGTTNSNHKTDGPPPDELEWLWRDDPDA